MVNSFLHTVPPVSSSSQINNYHIDREKNIDNEKLSSSFSSIQKQEYHTSLIATATTKNTSITNSSASADPFIHAGETWSIFNNTASYTNVIQSLRNIISFWIDIKQSSDDSINALCNSSHQQRKESNDFRNSSTQINMKQRPVITKSIPIYFNNKTVTSENNIHYYNNTNNVDNNRDQGNSLPLLENHQENPNSTMVIPYYRGYPLEHKNSKKNNSSHNQWFWPILSSKNKREDDVNDNNIDGLVIYCQETMRAPAQQKQPSWTFTHSYVRDTRINSAELRMISAEQNMIRNSKITRPLKNRRYQQRREDDFFWGQRSCLRIVHNVGEIHK